MKTATITLHSAHNNGSFLQAYSLQKAISILGYNNEIINYIPQAQYSLYQNIIFKDKSLKGIVKGALNIPNYRKLKLRKDKFNRAIKKLNLSKNLVSESEFEKLIQTYDCMIAGSDQIWNNATMPDFTELYLLPFNTFKISYAPSFGKSLKNQFNDPKVLEAISNFNRLSVREESVKKELTKRLPDKNIQVVMDPTFLISEEEYGTLIKNADCQFKDDFIFFYCIKASNEVLSTVREISRILKLPVVTVFTGVNTYKCQLYGQKVDFSAGPEEFVKYIKNAKYIISNSFHGIVFSIIFKKIFYRVADMENGNLKIDERLDSLLTTLGLNKQNVMAGETIELNREINFTDISQKVEILKETSLTWLRESIDSSTCKKEDL